MKELRSSWFPVLLGIIFLVAFLNGSLFHSSGKENSIDTKSDEGWQAPDINLVPNTPEGELIRYGRELLINTSAYFGPRGIVAPLTNGMNCQNCHLWAGTKAFGNSFTTVSSTYPKFRFRSGKFESIEFRINDCMERSLNGKGLDSLSKEMRAMVAYFIWIGKGVKKGTIPAGSGIIEIPFLIRSADPGKGKTIYENKCQRCHQGNGEGAMYPDSSGYIYPPLWGPYSFNVSAGLYRISRLAAFIKNNMPIDEARERPQLTDEEAWDVAAFISSQPRGEKRFANDWPQLDTKPPDYPFGPYADHFSEEQHKYGPFGPIKEAAEKNKGVSK